MNNVEIEKAAYFLWEKAGRPDGRSQEFWARAESGFRWPEKPVQIATEAVRRQLDKVLDRGDNRQKAERVRSTLKAIKDRFATFFAGNDV